MDTTTHHTTTTSAPRALAWIRGERDARGNCSVVAGYGDGSEAPLAMPVYDDGSEVSVGYEWGYHGTGPTALAEAMLAAILELPARTRGLATWEAIRIAGYDAGAFRSLVVARIPAREPGQSWSIMACQLRKLAEQCRSEAARGQA